MNILLAPDSFKGTLSASEVCDIIESALVKNIKNCTITKLPVADGGEGLCSSLLSSVGGQFISAEAQNPFGERMTAEYVVLNNRTAVIEMAACAGLPLAGDRANPLVTTTYGVGMLIADAQSKGIGRVILGLGGSATNDCGIGMAEALGYKFFDSNGGRIVTNGGDMIKTEHIFPPYKPLDIKVMAACDVTNPLYGENGAAYVFAPQKGADAEAVKKLDDGLVHMSEVIKRDIGINVSEIPGAGAAGGLGAGAVAFLKAELKSGIDIVLDTANFDKLLKSADLVITGEGRLDSQSVYGKVVSGVCRRAKQSGTPVVAVCGCTEDDVDINALGISKLYVSTKEPKPFEIIKKTCKDDLYKAALKIAGELEVL